MTITNNNPVIIFKNEDGKYKAGISNKKQDGSYEKATFPIQFNKGIELEDKTKIYIKNAWLSFYKWEYQDKKGTTFFIRCSDFEKVSETIENSKEEVQEDNNELYDQFADFGENVSIDDNFLD